MSERGVQLGYITAERAPYISRLIGSGAEVRAAFQTPTAYGAIVRATFDGNPAHLPPELPVDEAKPGIDDAFFPDDIWPD